MTWANHLLNTLTIPPPSGSVGLNARILASRSPPRPHPSPRPGHPARTSSTMSPFSACTWARAPRSRIMLKISYICEERRPSRKGPRLSRQQPERHPPARPSSGHRPYLAVSALAPVLVRHEDQEGVHTWRTGRKGRDAQPPRLPVPRGAGWDGASPWPSPRLAWQPWGTRPHTYRQVVMKDGVCQHPLPAAQPWDQGQGSPGANTEETPHECPSGPRPPL